MSANATPVTSESQRETILRQQILRRLLKVGCACVPDLVNEVDAAASADDLRPVIEHLLKDGLIRPMNDSKDSRTYENDQTVYELVK